MASVPLLPAIARRLRRFSEIRRFLVADGNGNNADGRTSRVLRRRTGMSLLETMEQLEPWLDRNNIRPVEFKHMVTRSGSIELQLTFRTREEASLFERAFCQVEA
jgi:hypothetical protein